MSKHPRAGKARPRLTVAPGFNPQSLPAAAIPVEGVRSWRWLADSATDPEQKTAYLERFVRGSGTQDPYHRYDRDRILQPLPAAQVVESHLLQHVFFDFVGAPLVSVVLSGHDDPPTDPAPGLFPFDGPIAIIGTAVQSGAAQQALGRHISTELAQLLSDEGIGYRRAVAADPGRRWVEEVLLVDYARSPEVRSAATVHLQPFLSVWRIADGRPVIEVVDLERPSEERVVAISRAELRLAQARTCPMIPGSGCGDLCRMAGGPWTSGSIHAAAAWEAKRDRMIGAVGCDTCGNGSIKVTGKYVAGGGRHTRSVGAGPPLPSRHDGLVSVAKPDQ